MGAPGTCALLRNEGAPWRISLRRRIHSRATATFPRGSASHQPDVLEAVREPTQLAGKLVSVVEAATELGLTVIASAT